MDELETIWDEAFNGVSEQSEAHVDANPPEAEQDPASEQNDEQSAQSGSVEASMNTQEQNSSDSEGAGDSGTEAVDTTERPDVSDSELAEINAILGTSYGSVMEIPGSRRYMELRENGRFTVKEAVLAVAGNVGAAKESSTVSKASKGHLSSSRQRGSNGEVLTPADKAELSKWGFKSSGAELEKLWRKTK